MSSGMNMAEAEEIAKKMTFREAVNNALRGRCVPFKKATRIKLNELLDMLDKGLTVTEFADSCRECGAKYGKYIKALEQENVLDKIRAEIMKKQTYKMFGGEYTVYVERDDVLAIIDKYKAESEEEE